MPSHTVTYGYGITDAAVHTQKHTHPPITERQEEAHTGSNLAPGKMPNVLLVV